jgi:hypothetical protein
MSRGLSQCTVDSADAGAPERREANRDTTMRKEALLIFLKEGLLGRRSRLTGLAQALEQL